MIVNKLWKEEIGKDYLWILKTIQRYIDLYCFEANQFRVIEDITPDNCADYWKIVLKQYQYYNVTLANLSDLGEALMVYFRRAYELEFAEYPVFPKNDRRNLAMYIDSYLQMSDPTVLLEDVPKLIEYLDTPNGNHIEASKVMDRYLSKFDYIARLNEYHHRRLVAIQKDRLEAIEKNLPIPIKPMSIKLDPCLLDPEKKITY